MQNRKSSEPYFRKIINRFLPALAILLIVFNSCTETPDITGEWRAVLKSPGGELAFPLIIQQKEDKLSAFAINSSDTSRFTNISIDGKSIRLAFDHYDAVINVDIKAAGLEGNWTRTAEDGNTSSLPFEAVKSTKPRYPVPSPEQNNFDGEWNVIFEDGDGFFPATGIFYGENGVLHGTFMTETGDYRFLEGVYSDSTFTLSTFDGTHAFLFDAKFHNKPFLVYLFGSWCPNCADEARLLKDLYEDYKGSELEIVGLAYEFTGNFERDAKMVDRYRKRFDIPWTLLIAGTSDKQDAAETLDFLDRVISYPTSVFTDSNHLIKFIHTGFNGPATGPYYYNEIERFKRSLDEITKN